MKLHTYVQIQKLFLMLIFSAGILSLLFAAGMTSQRTKQNVYVFDKISDYVGRTFQYKISYRSLYATSITTGTQNLTNITTTTTKPFHDYFRKWFDSRAVVKPYVPDEKHPYMPMITCKSNVCSNSSIDILIYFHSACENAQRRRVLRETWAHAKVFKDINIRVIFVLGRASNSEIRNHLHFEKSVYGDIVQGDFVDSFRNLTYKAMVALKWINDNCVHAKYVIKSDDDMFVNIMKVVEDLIPTIHKKKYSVVCHYNKDGSSLIIRDPKSKWFVPTNILANRKHFPKFCSGYTVVMTTDVIPLLYESSFRAPPLPVDDAYLFGLLPMFSKNLSYNDAKKVFSLNSKTVLTQYKSARPLTYIVANAFQDGSQEEFWSRALSKQSKWAKLHTNYVRLQSMMGPYLL